VFHHVTSNVGDLDRSRAFYSALPGFELDQDFPDLGKLRYRIGAARARLVLCAPLPGRMSAIGSTGTGSASTTSPSA